MARPPSISAEALREQLARLCPAARIDLAGAVSLPCPLPHRKQWLSWVADGRHAGLEYLARDPVGRADPTLAHDWAQSVLVFGQRYTDGWPPPGQADAGGSWTDAVARYARGRDYHEILHQDVKQVLTGLLELVPGLRTRVSVDTGPFLEREYAWLAGLGFFGRNCCLIHERLGSGLFLAVALIDLQVDGLPSAGTPTPAPLFDRLGRLPPGAPARSSAAGPDSRCGKCRLCLEACPTGALEAPFQLDARRCISTWTTEWRGDTSAELRPRQGGRFFGCDRCQAVCPWNHAAVRRAADTVARAGKVRGEYGVLPEHRELGLGDLLACDPARFRSGFRPTPLWRTHPEGMRRNALTVAANTGRVDLVQQVETVARDDPDQTTRAVARWALARLASAANAAERPAGPPPQED